MKIHVKAEACIINDNNEPVLEYKVDATLHSFEELMNLVVDNAAKFVSTITALTQLDKEPTLEPEIIAAMHRSTSK